MKYFILSFLLASTTSLYAQELMKVSSQGLTLQAEVWGIQDLSLLSKSLGNCFPSARQAPFVDGGDIRAYTYHKKLSGKINPGEVVTVDLSMCEEEFLDHYKLEIMLLFSRSQAYKSISFSVISPDKKTHAYSLHDQFNYITNHDHQAGAYQYRLKNNGRKAVDLEYVYFWPQIYK